MYQLVNPPFEQDFKDASEEQLQAYHEWFLGLIPERVRELEAEVRRTSGFEAWSADFTPASLDTLGEWFAGQVEERPLTDEEAVKGRMSVPEGMSFLLDELPRTTPTYRTLSLAFDVGVYLSQVFLNNCVGLSWQQVRSGKDYDDYGQSVLVGLGSTRCSPVLLAVTLAYGLSDGKKTGSSLRSLYEVWAGDN